MRPQVRECDLRSLTDTGKPGWLMSTDANRRYHSLTKCLGYRDSREPLFLINPVAASPSQCTR